MPTYVRQKEILQAIEGVRKIVLSPAMNSYIRKEEYDMHEMARNFHDAIERIGKSSKEIALQPEVVHKLFIEWKEFAEKSEEQGYVHLQIQFNRLWRKTEKMLRTIISPKSSSVSKPENLNIVRRRAARDVIEDIEDLDAKRRNILDQIELVNDNSKEGNEEIEFLQKELAAVQKQLQNKEKEQDALTRDEQTESNWDKRIENAFEILKTSTLPIDEERGRLVDEYNMYKSSITAIMIAIVIWLVFLYHALFVYHIAIIDWKSFLPYYLPIPILAALLWVVIVQKNRAGKLSISLSEELFRIRYIEGLLLSVNKLSANSDMSISRINKALDTMVESFLHQAERNILTEDKINAIEKKELTANHLMNLMNKLMDKV